MKPYFLTTSIPYASGKPHIGHALEYIQADVLARYARLQGREVFLSSGTDEHGQKIERAAAAVGQTPQAFVDVLALQFERLLKAVTVDVDAFVRTTDPDHVAVAQWLWQLAAEAGDLYKQTYRGFYCVGCEEYKQPAELDEAGQCPIHLTVPEEREQENWFFRLSKYVPELQKLYAAGDIVISPTHRTKETLNFLDNSADVSVSRPSDSLAWGIPVPGDDSQVMYVWFDALANYLTAARTDRNKLEIDRSDFVRWPADLHLVGKDIFRFHTIIWPAMLLSAKLPLPKEIVIHGFINHDHHKMSKSLGNVIDPFPLIEQYGVDAVRYYLIKAIPTTDDGNFSTEQFEAVYTADLVNNLGNLVQRTLTMLERYQVLRPEALPPSLPDWYQAALQARDFSLALNGIVERVSALNQQLAEQKPWEIAATQPERLSGILQPIYQALYEVAYLLQPFLPETASKLAAQLDSGQPEPLFPRLEQP